MPILTHSGATSPTICSITRTHNPTTLCPTIRQVTYSNILDNMFNNNLNNNTQNKAFRNPTTGNNNPFNTNQQNNAPMFGNNAGNNAPTFGNNPLFPNTNNNNTGNNMFINTNNTNNSGPMFAQGTHIVLQ